MTKQDAADHMQEGGAEGFRTRFDEDIGGKTGNGHHGSNGAGLTDSEREALHRLGLSDEDILEMGPAEARKILGPPPPPPTEDDLPPEEPEIQQCDRCGALNSSDAKKCNNCGADLGTKPPPHLGIKADYMGTKGKGACNVGNVRLVLDQEAALMNAFGFNEMSRTETLMRPLFAKDPDFKPRPVNDTDIIKVQRRLQWFRFRKLGEKPVRDAITEYAHDHPFNPLRDYLDGVAAKWDGKPRVGTWLHVYAGAEQTEYTSKVGTMFLIGMVARIYDPGCKNDYHPILEGPQGLEKSKLLEELAGEDYFSDQLPPIGSKDALLHLRGKWLCEFPEMHAYSKAEIDDYKRFMSSRIDRYRPPYGRKDVHERRTCCFAGTTNKMRYLRDETGNRRSWPVATGTIDLEAFKRERDQIWGEAVHLYRDGVRWWPDRTFEREHIRAQQEARFEPDPWEPLIKKYLDPLISDYLEAPPGSDLPRITMIDIAVDVFGFTTSNTQVQGEIKTPIVRLDPKVQGRIGAVLHHLGWVPKHDKHDRWWEPGPDATA